MPAKSDEGHPLSGDSARLRRFHRCVLDFAVSALDNAELSTLLQRATESVSAGIEVDRAKILRHRLAEKDLLVIAGVGWKPGVVGSATLPLGMRSPPGRAVATRDAVIIDKLPQHPEFDYSALLREHGILSLVNVPIIVQAEVWGVLEVDSTKLKDFDADDKDFLWGFANIIGRTIENRQRKEAAESILDRLSIDVREREVLFNEVQHRTANQMHAVAGALEVARRRIADPAALAELEKLLARVATMVTTNEQLSLAKIEREIGLGPYLSGLCAGFGRIENIRIVPRIEDAAVPLRVAVRLGLVVNELITNAIKYAFGSGGGTISIVFTVAGSEGTLIVADNGRGIQQRRQGSSGTMLMASLVDHIAGTINVASSSDGTAVTIRFPLPHASSAG